MVLSNNGSESLAASSNGAFAFKNKIESGKTYEVTVATLQLEDSGHEVRAGDRLMVVGENSALQVALIFAAASIDAWIVNDDLDKAYDELRAVYLASTLHPAHRPGLANTILEG